MINGQKVWTTQAQYADYIFLLARTDPDAPKHAGISYLLVPMRQPGVEVRPIEQVDGSAEFNEVFFTNVRCPRDNVVGGVNNGWKVAMTTLGFERGTSSTTGTGGSKRSSTRSSPRPAPGRRPRPAHPPAPRPVVVEDQDHADQRLPHAHRRAQRHAHDGGARAPATRCSGPRCTRRRCCWPWTCWASEGQILLGDDGGDTVSARCRAGPRRATRSDNLQALFFFSRSETIWGGTAEIQRNIVGERVLGLPKEPKPA